jgi:four helix bundle protein
MRQGRTFPATRQRCTAHLVGLVSWKLRLREGMHSPLRQQLLEQVLSSIELARPLVEAIARRDRDLGSQLRRALSSTALNVAEGFGTQAGNARLRFETACGSLYEAQAALRVAAAWGFVEKPQAAPVVHALDRLGARIFGLSRR